MLQRFVAGTAIASILIAIATFILLLIPNMNASPLTAIWCFAPLLWGVWAVCIPSRWCPKQLPAWGAVLGFFVALFAVFIVNIPSRVVGVTPSVGMRVFSVVLAVVAYYFLWMLVRTVYCSITAEPVPTKAVGAAGSK